MCAPSQRADIGIAVEGSTDAARAAADIVFTKPGLSTIVTAIVSARQICMRIKARRVTSRCFLHPVA